MDRIVMYTPSARGGHPLYTWELMTALTEHPRGGRRFELVSSQDLEQQFRSRSYPVHAILPKLSHRKEFSGTLSWAISRLLHYPRREYIFLNWLKRRPDIVGVHFQELSPLLAESLFRRIHRLGKKIFHTVHNLRPHAYPPLVPRQLWDHWHYRAWRRCDVLFVLTERLAEQLSELLGKGHPPIRVAPHGVWTLLDAPVPPPLKTRLGWKRLLFFGTLRRNKGVDLLLRAAGLLPGFSFTIAGEPLELDYFETEIAPRVEALRQKGIDITLRARFSSDEEAAQLFATHSALVLPYTEKFESQSGVLFLALAHQVPVIASEAGGLGDLLREHRIGALFRELTPEVLSQSIRNFFDEADQGEVVEQIRSARGRFSWRNTAAATIEGYHLPAAGAAGAHDSRR